MGNCIVKDKGIFASLSPVAKHIAAHDISAKMDSNLFSNMVTDAVNAGVKTRAEYLEYLRPYEEEILAIREANGEKVKSKGGKWLYSKVSMNPDGTKTTSSYRVNKSVIGKALEAGVPLTDNDGPIAKDVIEKSYKNVLEEPKCDRGPYSTACNMAVALRKVWSKLDEADQKSIKDYLEDTWK